MNSGFDPDQTTPSNQPKWHTFQPNQSLAEIADNYGLALSQLMEANDLSSTSVIFPGQKLLIPNKEQPRVQLQIPTQHIVIRGETLGSIANRNGLKVTVLQELNGLHAGSILFPGTSLVLVGEKVADETVSTDSHSPKHCLIHGYHKVKPGDQLSRIAAFHGVSTQALLMANDLSWNSVVSPGSKLIVPISHTPYTCPALVQLSTSSLDIAVELITKGNQLGLSEFGLVVALCLEMQRSGLQAELGSKQLTEEMLTRISKLAESELISVRETLNLIGFSQLAEGASLWEPSAWFWLYRIKSNNE
jgi:LysM repeat protein